MKDSKTETLTFLLPSLISGGAERVFLNLATTLSRTSGYQVHLVLIDSSVMPRHTPPADLQVIDLKCSRAVLSGYALVRYLKKTKPKAVYSALDQANCMLLLATWFCRVKPLTVVTLHNDVKHSLLSKNSFRKVQFTFMKYAYRHADHIIAVSEGVAASYIECTKHKCKNISVILNPVLNKRILEQSLETPVHLWLDAKVAPVLVAVGRLESQKNYPLLISAFAKVIEERPARLIILGTGEQLDTLRNQIELLGLTGNIDLIGFARNPYKFMANADVFVLSSDYEGLPTVLIEALYCGAKVVSTDCDSGPREILDNGKYGLLSPVGDADALAASILSSLNSIVSRDSSFPYGKYEQQYAANQYLKLLEIED